MGTILAILSVPIAVVLIAWSAAALWFDGPASRPLAGLAAAAFVVGALVLLLRPRGLVLFAFLFLAILGWWLAISPRNDRNWSRDVRVAPTAELHGDVLTVRGVRNFSYRSEVDWDEHWEDRTYDLSQLRGLDLFMSYWGSPTIAHTIMSWEFASGPPLAISIETRKEQGESYSAVRGFFRQYELYYVVADERDLVALRTNHRGEQVFLYRLRTPPARVRALLLAYVDAMNCLAQSPEWYNALTQNCTTSIEINTRTVTRDGGPTPVWDWRLYLNGRLDELLHEQGIVNASQPYPAIRAASDITARARSGGDGPGFSERIREGLPARPPFPQLGAAQ